MNVRGTYRMNRQTGFTLIELMIVVSIIAILAAIALPFYQDYIARAQLTEAVTLAGALKTPLATDYSELPASFCSMPTSAVSEGKYVATVVVANASPTNCDVIATMKPGIAPKASGKTVTFNYKPGNGAWTCTSDANPEVTPRACI